MMLLRFILLSTVLFSWSQATSAEEEEEPANFLLPSYPVTYSTGSILQKSGRDNFLVPEWLQNIPQESRVAKYRKRRFLNFPTGSSLIMRTALSIAVKGIPGIVSVDFGINMNVKLPNNSDINLGRSLDGAANDRRDFLGRMETFLSTFGIDGHECTLRTICEVAELPFDHGVFGEVINMILTATIGSSSHYENNEITDEYAEAEYHGREHGSCDSIYAGCPLSIANILSSAVPISP
ncbi:uncharacterized protein LOC135215000 [Macrobrachium nipponense]|uniref:uncharacterized protein LOC135215000 n=1 Tax=Macrobrachium nipponense TaxID=159736 RepID=UPI0030C87A6F